MLFETLDRIRRKPKAVRNQYAFGAAVTFTLLIAGVWSLSIPARFASIGNVAAIGSASSSVPTTPFAGLLDQLKHQFESAKDIANTIPQATSTAHTQIVSTTTLSDTEAALNLQINEENKTTLQASSSGEETNSRGRFDFAEPSTQQQTIMIATTSATSAE